MIGFHHHIQLHRERERRLRLNELLDGLSQTAPEFRDEVGSCHLR